MAYKSLPPHPSPLPWGEGNAMAMVGCGCVQVGRSEVVERLLPPHPSPLPWGEGAPSVAALFEFGPARTSRFPLPRGECQGEGEENVRSLKLPSILEISQ